MTSRKSKSSAKKKPAADTAPPASTSKSQSDLSGFPIVGIGASAGGLEALDLFFQHMPEDSGMAFVVIQHLDPNHAGIMPELLQRCTQMKVLQVTDWLRVKPNHVYVIPPNRSMSILNGALHLFLPVESHGLRLPIDIFFRSLAEDQQDRSIGIILSGMGSDGSHGLKAIKELNGVAAAQEPSSAKFDGMPRSAIEAVQCDLVESAENLPGKLLAFLKVTTQGSRGPESGTVYQSNLEKIILLIREQTGNDFSLYKKNTLFRRIERRKGVHQIENIPNYVRFLQENPAEVQILFKELLIGVTSFFRDAAVWDALREKILPQLIAELPDKYILRAWITGCSTGEEAFSLAIVFKEIVRQASTEKRLSLQIFATDLDTEAIEIARKGYFRKNIAAEMSSQRLQQFFTPEGDGYRINYGIREMVVFAPQNVIKDPPFTKLDLLFCRNMLIYMEPVLQKKLLVLFHYSLNSNGVLLLGNAESVSSDTRGFTALDLKLKIFKRISSALPSQLLDFPSSFRHPNAQTKAMATTDKPVENIQGLTDQILLQRFAPASVLVNLDGDIVYITGRTGKYLEPVAGKTNWNIYAMAREGLRSLLPKAFRDASQSFAPVLLQDIILDIEGSTLRVDVTLQRLENPAALRGFFIIVFSDIPARMFAKVETRKPGKEGQSPGDSQLEEEVQRLREELQTVREEMQTSQEELKSTNEELQSTNEELQSTNEELTTSKEEMQSLNEELQTVNMELQSKVTDFLRADDDMKNLLNSTEIATLFLDRDQNIRRYTDQITSIFKLRMADIGRPFTDLVNDLRYPELAHHASQVLKTLVSMETETETQDGRWLRVRIMPYRTLDDRIEGLVLTFVDTTMTKKLELKLLAANQTLKDDSANPLVDGYVAPHDDIK